MVTTTEALRRALRSMTDGPGDPTSIEGAKVNALESIAWSLMGLLTDKVQDPQALADLSVALERYGLLTVER